MSTAVIGGVVGIVVLIVIILILKNKKKPEEIKETKKEEKPKEQKQEVKKEKKEEKKLPDIFMQLTKDINELQTEIEKNIEAGMNEYSMDRDSMVMMVKELESQIAENKDSIYNLMAQKNWEEMEKHIHTLKGSSLNLRFDILAKPIAYIDDLLKKQQDLDNIKEYVDTIYANYEKIFKAL
jgi:HPt (histidine-containing phosphotransfer) domain-containing protein